MRIIRIPSSAYKCRGGSYSSYFEYLRNLSRSFVIRSFLASTARRGVCTYNDAWMGWTEIIGLRVLLHTIRTDERAGERANANALSFVRSFVLYSSRIRVTPAERKMLHRRVFEGPFTPGRHRRLHEASSERSPKPTVQAR